MHVYLDSLADGSKYKLVPQASALFANETALNFASADQQATGANIPFSASAQQVPTVGTSIRKYSGTILLNEPIAINIVAAIKK